MITDELVKDIYDNAVAHGFFDKPQAWNKTIELLHTEPAEATEDDRNGIVDSVKAKGFTALEEEIADTWIRSINLLGKWEADGINTGEFYSVYKQGVDSNALHIADVHAAITDLYRSKGDSEASCNLANLVCVCEIFADAHGLRLKGAIAAKHEYNKSRPFKHGGKKY